MKAFLRNLVAQSGFTTRWELAFAAGIPESNINEWLSNKGSLPSAANLLRLLQATDAIDERFLTEPPIPTRRPRLR